MRYQNVKPLPRIEDPGRKDGLDKTGKDMLPVPTTKSHSKSM